MNLSLIHILSASSKAKTDGAAKSYKVTAKSGLNVRSGPSTSYGKYGALVCGAELQVEGIENGWAKVSYNGKTAYVSASYIKESGGGGGEDVYKRQVYGRPQRV